MRCAIVIAIVVALPSIVVVHVQVVVVVHVVVVVVCCSCPRATEVYRGSDLACGAARRSQWRKQRNSRGIIWE